MYMRLHEFLQKPGVYDAVQQWQMLQSSGQTTFSHLMKNENLELISFLNRAGFFRLMDEDYSRYNLLFHPIFCFYLFKDTVCLSKMYIL